jgi:hypothetical protein
VGELLGDDAKRDGEQIADVAHLRDKRARTQRGRVERALSAVEGHHASVGFVESS